jgi:branched-chain amino acid transport system permease protein
MKIKNVNKIFYTFIFLLLFLLPLSGNFYYINLFTEIIIISLLVMSLNILIGYTGMISLGHAVFLGLGAYTSALVMKDIYPSIMLGIFSAAIISALYAFIVGIFCVRVSGLYFAMITLAFSQAIYTITYYWTNLTGGDDGMIGIPRPDLNILGIYNFSLESLENYYYFSLIVVSSLFYVMKKILDSPFGTVLQAIRENPERVQFLGISVFRYKLGAFVLSGFFAGIAGGLFAPFQGFISPELIYWTRSGEIILMTILGGMNSFIGPGVGAGILILLKDIILNYTEYWRIFLGSMLIFFVLFMPGGFVGFISEKFNEIFKKKK